MPRGHQRPAEGEGVSYAPKKREPRKDPDAPHPAVGGTGLSCHHRRSEGAVTCYNRDEQGLSTVASFFAPSPLVSPSTPHARRTFLNCFSGTGVPQPWPTACNNAGSDAQDDLIPPSPTPKHASGS
jgi:hypothetical protein